ncbi:unnamed protein product, partial [Discosporangium mesarthrocarpum]
SLFVLGSAVLYLEASAPPVGRVKVRVRFFRLLANNARWRSGTLPCPKGLPYRFLGPCINSSTCYLFMRQLNQSLHDVAFCHSPPPPSPIPSPNPLPWKP